jgi:hypothetical protein
MRAFPRVLTGPRPVHHAFERIGNGSMDPYLNAPFASANPVEQFLVNLLKLRCPAGQDVKRDEGVDHR